MHRNTPSNETIIVEYGFLDSSGDDVDQIINDWKNLTEGVLKALVPYVGGVYVPLDENFIYYVQIGDTLYSIATKFGTTVDVLKQINNLTSDTVYIGQRIYLPGINDVEINTYTVVSGDTLYSIASKFSLSVDQLREYNNLSSDILSVGQILYLTNQDMGDDDFVEVPLVYVVQSGDTLYSVANKFGLTVNNLREFNNLTSDTLSVGQVLNLTSTSDDVLDNPEYYTVQPGDTLYSISSKFSISVSDLKLINNLKSDVLSVGQILYLNFDDSALDNFFNYTVVPGDTLYSIAKKFNSSYSEIYEFNNLTTNMLSIGQVLKIPGNGFSEYTVKSGDSLYKIALEFNTTVQKLRDINNLTSDLLSIGQVLFIS